MRAPSYTSQFRRDVKLAEKRGKDMAKLRHPLKGAWKNYRDLHIEPDWLLIYRADETSVLFERTGTHADLFDE